MSSSQSKATLASFFPDAFSRLPENFRYSEEVENSQNYLNIDDLDEKINEIDLSIQVSSKKKKRARSRSSFSTRSSHSSRSSKTQNSDLTSSSFFQTTGSLSNLNSNTINQNPSPPKIKIKISHIIKRKKKKNSRKNAHRIKNYMKSISPPRVQTIQSNEQKKIIKKPVLPYSVLYPGYQIRFNYHPKDVVRINESPGCPTVLTYRNGDIETRYKDGTSQITHIRNKFTYFANGDAQHEFHDGAVAYFYASNKSIEFTHPNGTRVLQFSNGERYTYHPNVKIDITYHQNNNNSNQQF